MNSTIDFSIILPVYNEEENLPELYRRLTATLSSMNSNYELIFVDDHSRDNTLLQLKTLSTKDERVKVISLARNFGHQMAISAGLDFARGQAVILMDADLQDPPEVLPQFIEKWREGFDVVYAVREKRKEHIFKRVAYHSFYLVLRLLTQINIPLDSGDFCIMDRRVVDVLRSFPERARFIRGLRSWVGFRQVGLAYERDRRFAGSSNYTFSKLVRLALDGMISFSDLPLEMASFLGFSVAGLSILLGLYYLATKLIKNMNPAGFPTLVILMLFLGGVQLITIGVIGEYIGRILHEVRHRPMYIVDEIIGYEEPEN
jgi:polyisoprenyl-phosphate glycosyltransferase